jgi:hypothetical protein
MADGMQRLPDGVAKLANSHSASAQIAQHRSQLHGFHQCNFKKTFSSSVRKCLQQSPGQARRAASILVAHAR